MRQSPRHARRNRSGLSARIFLLLLGLGAVPAQAQSGITQQAYVKPSNPDGEDQFGRSVSISGDTLVVGAYLEDSISTGVNNTQSSSGAPDSGAAYVLVRSGTTWMQEAYVKASNTGTTDRFGHSVSISGDTLVVGAFGEASPSTGVGAGQGDGAFRAGAAYVFFRDGTGWSQQEYIKASNTDANDDFGFSVAISGDTLVVGARGESSGSTGVDGPQGDDGSSSAGAAYVFVRSGTMWTQQAYVKASNTQSGDEFGYSVAIDGDTIVVGAPLEDSGSTGVDGDGSNDDETNSGAAYVFVRHGMTWTPQAYLKATNAGENDEFGRTVSVSGDRIVVGAPFESSASPGVNGAGGDDDAMWAGAAYVYERSGSDWAPAAYLKPSVVGAGDRFGASVAVEGEAVIVGAAGEASGATGVDADPLDGSAVGAGAAYVFGQGGGGWSQVAYLKASNAEADDRFGYSVSLSSDSAVISARYEESTFPGVNGNESDNSLTEAGAAYVFVLPDCDDDGVPDAGESDCDGDGVPDDCDSEPDLNGDGVPDVCQPVAFCFGFGCPCGNDDSLAGCANSSGSGALLSGPPTFATGGGGLTLSFEGGPPNGLALMLVSDTLQSVTPLFDGRSCLSGPSTYAYRFTPRRSGPGGSFMIADATAELPVPLVAGESYFFQAWYRDVFCTPLPVPCPSPCASASNFTNAVGLTVVP